MQLQDILDFADLIREKPPVKKLLALVSVVALLGLVAFYQGYCTDKGKQLASEPAPPSAAPDRAGKTAAPSVRVESKGDYSPNIVGNRGPVTVEIDASPEEKATKEKGE